MTLQRETAPDGTPERLRKHVRCAGPNNSEDTSRQVDYQAIEDISRCLDTALEHERGLARQQLRLRRLILDLKIKRDHLHDLGEMLRGAA